MTSCCKQAAMLVTVCRVVSQIKSSGRIHFPVSLFQECFRGKYSGNMAKRTVQTSIKNFTEGSEDGQSEKKKLKSSEGTPEQSSKAKASADLILVKEIAKSVSVLDRRMNPIKTDFDSIDFQCNKQSASGKNWNLKIASWNVASLRALVKKVGMEYMKREAPDIMCFQETKCSESNAPKEAKLGNYFKYFTTGYKSGYAGVALYSKVKPLDVKYEIGSDYDDEGRVIIAEYKKFFVVNAYVPNAGRELVTLPKRMDWDVCFKEFLSKLNSKKPVILCGDLNVAHQEIDLKNPDSNIRSAGFTEEERNAFTALLNEGFVDTFRELYPAKTETYTYWTYMGGARSRNVGWRLDYFVVSKRLMPDVCDSVIRNDVYGSDHCPITLFLNV